MADGCWFLPKVHLVYFILTKNRLGNHQMALAKSHADGNKCLSTFSRGAGQLGFWGPLWNTKAKAREWDQTPTICCWNYWTVLLHNHGGFFNKWVTPILNKKGYCQSTKAPLAPNSFNFWIMASSDLYRNTYVSYTFWWLICLRENKGFLKIICVNMFRLSSDI